MTELGPCCCRWGAAVSGEWPEFECFECPIHGGELSIESELCKRHKYESLVVPEMLDIISRAAVEYDQLPPERRPAWGPQTKEIEMPTPTGTRKPKEMTPIRMRMRDLPESFWDSYWFDLPMDGVASGPHVLAPHDRERMFEAIYMMGYADAQADSQGEGVPSHDAP